MTKKDMIDIITSSPAWDGANAKTLNRYLKSEIKDIFDQLEEAEEDYYSY